MASCPRCGAELPATARFCPACGRPVEPEVGPQPPPLTRPVWADVQLPDWARADWALVGLGAARLLLVLFAASALVGLVAAVTVAGSLAAAPCGAAVGSHLAFAAFGARTAAGCGGEHGAVIVLGFLPLPWAVMAGVATEAALRFGWRRLPDDRARRVAYAGKLALVCGAALGVIAGLVSRGDVSRFGGSGFASSLNGGEVWFNSTVLTWFWAWIGLRRRGLTVFASPGPLDAPSVRSLRPLVVEGATVFATLVAGLAVVGLVFALAVADGGRERIGLLFGFPVAGLSFGAALVDAAMGAALGGVTGHTSLFHFGLPAGPGAGAAPGWLFGALALVPAAVAAAVWRRLERDRPADEQGALAVGAATGAAFAVCAWGAALVGRVVVLAAGNRSTRGLTDQPLELVPLPQVRATVGTLVSLRPNPAAVLGLGLLWGLAGALGAAFLWASRHNARWQINGVSQEADAGEDPPPDEKP